MYIEGGGGHKLQIDDVFLGGVGGLTDVDMGRYEGGRGLKWPKIGDVVYGWPLRTNRILRPIMLNDVR